MNQGLALLHNHPLSSQSVVPVSKVIYNLLNSRLSHLTPANAVLPHIINGAIFTSAFSAGNSFLFCSSRVLYGLALRGQAPKFLTYCTKNGLPLFAVLVCVSECLSLQRNNDLIPSFFLSTRVPSAGCLSWTCQAVVRRFSSNGALFLLF